MRIAGGYKTGRHGPEIEIALAEDAPARLTGTAVRDRVAMAARRDGLDRIRAARANGDQCRPDPPGEHRNLSDHMDAPDQRFAGVSGPGPIRALERRLPGRT